MNRFIHTNPVKSMQIFLSPYPWHVQIEAYSPYDRSRISSQTKKASLVFSYPFFRVSFIPAQFFPPVGQRSPGEVQHFRLQQPRPDLLTVRHGTHVQVVAANLGLGPGPATARNSWCHQKMQGFLVWWLNYKQKCIWPLNIWEIEVSKVLIQAAVVAAWPVC